MSVVTLEKETLVVMTELADEEISGVVGGGADYSFYAKKIDIDVKNDNDVKIGSVKGGKNDINVTNQTSTAVAVGGNAYASNYSDSSRDRAYIGW
ncbi:MAG: hypothetical protein RMX96_27715 [Nostoc sp. ChiSLP02]|nr:hypothetical protein [Nostoc sp. DedSLP05]MDZ8098355.1 hypothetical protein [Nostoc sp. DedSLP01]MDZ8188629.1 hypothetical protein [Nostoc sp. ChiSLP02]